MALVATGLGEATSAVAIAQGVELSLQAAALVGMTQKERLMVEAE